jgi:ABC-type multidrug transport system fused ATPase/permease subunit
MLGFLDLLGIAVIGVIGAVAISGIGAQQPGNRVSAVLDFLQLGEFSLQAQTGILGAIAAFLLIGKTVISIIFMRKTLFFLSRRSAVLSSQLVAKLFAKSLTTLQSKSMNEMMYAVTGGVSLITVGVLGTAVSLISDISLLLVMAAGLLVVDAKVAISTFMVFGLVGFALYKIMHLKARDLGLKNSEISIKSNQLIYEALGSYRETIVRNRRDFYSREIGKTRSELSNILAEISFMPNISKYVMEVSVIVGSLAISAVQFIATDAVKAVAVMSVFLAASTRIAPAILRIQQGAITIKSNLGAATPTLELVELLKDTKPVESVSDVVLTQHDGFRPHVQVSGVTFSYPGSKSETLSEVSFEILPGEVVAIVGPSGAGKTTLVDVILGVLEPDIGRVSISGLKPSDCVSRFPGAIAYVPQDVIISHGSIRENVGMGYPLAGASDSLVDDALEIAQLSEYVKGLERGLETQVGDRGTRISGGQRQRLGIARAMFTKPMMLVLDEATSSLDGETEADLSDAVMKMKGQVTVILIAHRLSTVRNSDKVLYLENGQIVKIGTFDEVRQSVPDFDNQAKLMGL